MSKARAPELWICRWCSTMFPKNSINGYCQKCFEKKLVRLIEYSAYQEMHELAKRLRTELRKATSGLPQLEQDAKLLEFSTKQAKEIIKLKKRQKKAIGELKRAHFDLKMAIESKTGINIKAAEHVEKCLKELGEDV